MVGCAVIGGINVVAMIVQGILLTKVYKMMPNLASLRLPKSGDVRATVLAGAVDAREERNRPV